MPLRRKLVLSLAGPAVLVAGVGVLGISSLGRLGRSADDILSDNYHSIQNARRMERILRQLELHASSEQVTALDAKRLGSMLRGFDEALALCERNVTEKGESSLLLEVRRHWQRARRLYLRRSPAQDNAKAVIGSLFELYRRIDKLVDINERAMFSREQRTRGESTLMAKVMWGSLAASLLVLFIFATIIAGRIARPILAVAENLHQTLVSSDRAEESHASADEIKQLRHELDGLLHRLERYEREQASQLMRLEVRLAHVIEKVQEGIVLLDPARRVVAINGIGREILRLQKPPNSGAELLEQVRDHDAHGLLRAMFAQNAETENGFDEVHRSVDGTERTYRPRILPLLTEAGAAEGYLIIFWDVTEERRTEESKRRFIAMLSHQLKTPMTSLAMSVNLLWEELRGTGGEAGELLAIAREDCEALSSLVTQLIDAARGVAPDLALSPQHIDVVRLLRAALRPLTPQAQEKNLDLRDELGEQPILLDVDPVKFPWVVTNIVGNALRYTPPGGSITVKLSTEEQKVVVSVEDTGVGIALENLNRVFLPYSSADRTLGPGSHGLGLAIAREIVEAHHGSIEVQSEWGSGARFTICLPRGPGGTS